MKLYQLFYLISALLVGALAIYVNLESPPFSTVAVGGGAVVGALLSLFSGRAIQLLKQIRDRKIES
jgi:hypothetical protein